MNREIDLTRGKCDLDFLGEETFAADFGEQPVLYLIASRLDDPDFDIFPRKAVRLAQKVANRPGLGQRKRRTPRPDTPPRRCELVSHGPHPANSREHPLDMRNWRLRQNTVSKIEDERSTVERLHNVVNGAIERFTAGPQGFRIKIALHRDARLNICDCKFSIDRRLETDSIHAGPVYVIRIFSPAPRGIR